MESGTPPAVPFFQQIQARLERQFVESTLKRREQQRQERIPDIDVPLFEFERARANQRRDERLAEEARMLEAASGTGKVHEMTELSNEPTVVPRRRLSVRSWKSMNGSGSDTTRATHLGSIYEADNDGSEPMSAQEARECTKANSNVKRTADVFWLTCSRDQLHGVLQKEYLEMYMLMLKTLYESFDEAKAGIIARKQWAQVVGPAPNRGLSRETMRKAILDMADYWVVGTSPEEYVDFLRVLFYRIACQKSKASTGEYRWRELTDVCSSLDETRHEVSMATIPDYGRLMGGQKRNPLPKAVSSASAPRSVDSNVASGKAVASEKLTLPTITTHASQKSLPQGTGGASRAKRPSLDDIDMQILKNAQRQANSELSMMQHLRSLQMQQETMRNAKAPPRPAARAVNGRPQRRPSRDTNWLEINVAKEKKGINLMVGNTS